MEKVAALLYPRAAVHVGGVHFWGVVKEGMQPGDDLSSNGEKDRLPWQPRLLICQTSWNWHRMRGGKRETDRLTGAEERRAGQMKPVGRSTAKSSDTRTVMNKRDEVKGQ